MTRIYGLITARGRPDVACVMRDVSEGGALLEMPYPQWCPSRFRLVIEGTDFETECEVMHRSETAVGVRFATPARF